MGHSAVRTELKPAKTMSLKHHTKIKFTFRLGIVQPYLLTHFVRAERLGFLALSHHTTQLSAPITNSPPSTCM